MCVVNAHVHVESLLPSFPPTLPYWCQLMQQLLHNDTYLKQLWQTAIQWLQYEMKRVCSGH